MVWTMPFIEHIAHGLPCMAISCLGKLDGIDFLEQVLGRCRQRGTGTKGDGTLALDTPRCLGLVVLGLVHDVLLDFLELGKGHALRLLGDDLGRQLSSQDGTLHGSQKLLRRPVPTHGEVGDGASLAGSELVAARNGGVDGSRDLDDGVLAQTGLTVGALVLGGRPLVVGGNFGGEQARQFSHGGIDDLFVGFGNPVGVTPGDRGAGREDQFQHAGIGIVVFLAGDTHVGVDTQQGRSGKAQVIDGLELSVEPHVQVDDGDALEFVELTEIGHLLPFLGGHALDNINRHCRYVLVGNDFFPASQEQVLDGFSVGFVYDDFFDGGVHDNASAPCLDVFFHGSTEPIGLVSVQKGHLQAVVFVQETVHGGQDNRHGKLVGIDKIQGLGHGNKDLRVDTLGHAVFSHEIRDAEFVLGIDKGLSLDEHGQQRGCRLDFLSEREHFLVHENGQTKVEGGGDSGDEIEGGEFTGQFLHGEDHLVDLPLQTIVDVEFVEQIHHVGVGSKENVQTSFDPIAVRVLPRRDFSAQHVPGFVHNGFVAGVRQVLGAGQSGESSTDDGDLFLLGRIGDLELAVERAGQFVEQPVVVRVFDVGFGEILHDQVGRRRLDGRTYIDGGVGSKTIRRLGVADNSREKGKESAGRPLHCTVICICIYSTSSL
mmetsp:Transcript_19464/g.42292  ORF Transcript_19464/g.42292 Transcript_19464/m.42292 type:complete len:655 (-) Transcript_19464:324-2288(-)